MEYWMASNESDHNGREEKIQEVLRDPGSVVLFDGYPRWLLHFAAGCCILFMLVGIPGNLFTIIALFRSRKLRNATAIFIINLSISDLMFCCFNLPLAMSTFWHSSWHHGALLCRLFPLLRYGLVAVSLFTILAITFNRYIMIGHPRIYPRLYKPKYLVPMVLSTWIIAFGFLIVTWFGRWGRFGLDVAIGSCSILRDVNGRSPKEFLFVVAFLIPCIAIVVCYARIFYIVRKTAHKSRKRKAAANIDIIEPNHERRSVSPRNPEEEEEEEEEDEEEEEELSVLGSSCAASVLCANFSSKCAITVPNRLDGSPSPSRSVLEESLSEQPSWEQNSIKQEKEENKKDKEQIKRDKTGDCKKNHHQLSIPKVVEVCDKARSSMEIKIDDIPYVDDLEAAETILPNSDRKNKDSAGKGSANARNRLERMTSRASFIIESTLWIQKLNLKTTTGSDRLDSSRSNTPERSTKRRPTIFRRESKFRSVRRCKNPDAPPRMSNKDKKLLKMILVIFSSFLICYLPITVTKTFKDTIDWRGLNIAGYVLIYLTTCINPVVYVVMSSEYRSAYKNVLLCRNDSGMKNATRKPLG